MIAYDVRVRVDAIRSMRKDGAPDSLLRELTLMLFRDVLWSVSKSAGARSSIRALCEAALEALEPVH